jgi:hypothetical protein
MMDPPHEPHKVRIARPPSWFRPPHDQKKEFRILEPVYEGNNIQVVGENNISKETTSSYNLDVIQK